MIFWQAFVDEQLRDRIPTLALERLLCGDLVPDTYFEMLLPLLRAALGREPEPCPSATKAQPPQTRDGITRTQVSFTAEPALPLQAALYTREGEQPDAAIVLLSAQEEKAIHIAEAGFACMLFVPPAIPQEHRAALYLSGRTPLGVQTYAVQRALTCLGKLFTGKVALLPEEAHTAPALLAAILDKRVATLALPVTAADTLPDELLCAFRGQAGGRELFAACLLQDKLLPLTGEHIACALTEQLELLHELYIHNTPFYSAANAQAALAPLAQMLRPQQQTEGS